MRLEALRVWVATSLPHRRGVLEAVEALVPRSPRRERLLKAGLRSLFTFYCSWDFCDNFFDMILCVFQSK